MALLLQGLGAAAPAPPTAARDSGRLPASVRPRSQGVTVTAGSQEVGGRRLRDLHSVPASHASISLF